MSERDPIQSLWAAQLGEHFTMSIADIRARAAKLQSAVQQRNLIEYAAGGVAIAGFVAATIFAASTLGKVSCAVAAAGCAFVLWRLHVQARAASRGEMAVTESWAEFYRQELVRQRDALASAWLWYLGPLVPGMAMIRITAGINSALRGATLWGWAVMLLGIGVTGVVFAYIARANANAAKALQAEIEALDAVRERTTQD
jgi:hypothetical protein